MMELALLAAYWYSGFLAVTLSHFPAHYAPTKLPCLDSLLILRI
jgi:hypothetical protein